jgi:hypothetical protein
MDNTTKMRELSDLEREAASDNESNLYLSIGRKMSPEDFYPGNASFATFFGSIHQKME